MLVSLLATSLLLAPPMDGPSRSERAFEAAKRLEVAGYTPGLVYMMEGRRKDSWQIVSFYRVSHTAPNGRWIVRRERVGRENWEEYVDSPRVPLAWADSQTCEGVIPLLEAVEQIRPMPLDVFRVGTEYGVDDPVIVGGARTTFWLEGATVTPSVQMRGYYYMGRWWDGAEALQPCWSTTAPRIARED